MSQPKSNEAIVEAFIDNFCDNITANTPWGVQEIEDEMRDSLSKLLAQKDAEVAEAIKAERDKWVKPLLEDTFMVTIEGRFDKRVIANRKVVSMKSIQATGGRTLLLEAEACAHEIIQALATPPKE